MISGDQGLTLLAAANPMPNPDTIDNHVEVDEYLTGVSGTTDMTDLGTKRSQQITTNRTVTRWLITAAALIAVVGLAVFLTANEPAPTAATPATIVEGADEWLLIPTDIPNPENGPEICCGYEFSADIDDTSGTYRSHRFIPGFSFSVPNNWDKWEPGRSDVPETSNVWLTALHPRENSRKPWDAIVVMRLARDSVDAAVGAITEVEGVNATEPRDVVLGGAVGKTFEVAVADEPVAVEGIVADDGGSLGFGNAPSYGDGLILFHGPTTPVYVLNVQGEVVLILIEAEITGDEFIEVAQSVVDTIVWRDLGK